MLISPWGTRVGVGIGLACAMAGPLSAQHEGPETLEKRLESLREEFQQAERNARKAYASAATPEAQAKASQINPWATLHERVEALAFEAEGSEVAAGAWALIFTNEFRYGLEERGWEAFGILINDHPDSSELQAVADHMQRAGRDDPRGVEGLELLLETSSNRGVQGTSLFSLAKLLETDEATRGQAFEYYRRVVADYADVEGSRGLLGKQAEGALFEAEHLQVGLAVPDIAAVDETGAAFRLSDYKGKVVLVDFWGFW